MWNSYDDDDEDDDVLGGPIIGGNVTDNHDSSNWNDIMEMMYHGNGNYRQHRNEPYQPSNNIREYLHLHIGDMGCEIGEHLWELYSLEHGIVPAKKNYGKFGDFMPALMKENHIPECQLIYKWIIKHCQSETKLRNPQINTNILSLQNKLGNIPNTINYYRNLYYQSFYNYSNFYNKLHISENMKE